MALIKSLIALIKRFSKENKIENEFYLNNESKLWFVIYCVVKSGVDNYLLHPETWSEYLL